MTSEKMAVSPLDAARKSKDKSYKHVFKGSVLINTLMEYSGHKFTQRSRAIAFGQKLLDMNHIESVVGSKTFEDGVSLYRWCDESVIAQAKKMVTTTTSHIPKKRLIELLDMEQGDGVDGYNISEVKDRVINKLDRTVPQPDTPQKEARHVGRLSRKDLDFAQKRQSQAESENSETSTITSFKLTTLDVTSTPSGFNEQSSVEEEYTTSDNATTSRSESLTTDSPVQELGDGLCEQSHHHKAFDDTESDTNLKPHKKFEEEDSDLQVEDREALQTLESLTQESSSFSDNEKKLLEQMKKMQDDHKSAVRKYEDRIQQLHKTIEELQNVSDQKKTEAQAETIQQKAEVTATPSVPAPPPLIPLAPTFGLQSKDNFTPSKPDVKPRIRMRQLFWERIVFNDPKEKRRPDNTIWQNLSQPRFDMYLDELEEKFGYDRQPTSNKRSLHDAMSPTRSGLAKVKTVKLLEDNRSRTIGIRLRSMHCQMGDIRDAVYKLHFDKLDEEGLHSLYELRGSPEEIEKIETHMKEHRKRSSALDQPEQFLYEVSRMPQFEERVECLVLRKRFNEMLFNIDEQLNLLQTACDGIRNQPGVKTVLEVILGIGNYMNGGTTRGQADGFDVNIMSRLKDVKAGDNSMNFLQFVVRVHTREHEEDAGQNGAKFKLPEPLVMQKAAAVSIKDLSKELKQIQPTLKAHQKKAEKVYNAKDQSKIQPFKNKMEEFFADAHALLKRQDTKYEEVKRYYEETLQYISVKSSADEMTSDAFFSNWAQFIVDYKMYWEMEQKRIAKEMFARMEQRKKERRQKVKRRKSIVEEGRENLKQKFAQMRRRSEHAAPHTALLMRSQSVSSIDTISSQSTNSLERRRRAGGGGEGVVVTGMRDDDSVFGDDEKSEAGVTNGRRRRSRNIEPAKNGVGTRHESLDRTISSESGVDSTPQRNIGRMPALLNSLGDSNAKIKLYYRKTREDSTDSKSPEALTTSHAERQRRRFVPDTITKTGDSMIERLQQRRQRRSVAESDTHGAEGGYESSHTVRASGDDTDKESTSLQERIMRRRSRHSLTDDARGTVESNLAKTPAGLRRSRTLLSDTDSTVTASSNSTLTLSSQLRRSRTNLSQSALNVASEDTTPGNSLTSVASTLRRSRQNLLDDATRRSQDETKSNNVSSRQTGSTLRRSHSSVADSIFSRMNKQNQEVTDEPKGMLSVAAPLRRSRQSVVDDPSSKPETTDATRSTYVRRSRTNLVEDLRTEGTTGVTDTRTRSMVNDRRNNLLQARSRYGQSMESVKSVGSTGAESTSSVRTRTRPSLSVSDTRRRLPAEPKSLSTPSPEPPKTDGSVGLSTWKNRMFDSIKDTVTSAGAGITALAQKFDPSIGQNATDNAKADINHNNPTMKDRNEVQTRRERSRRHSDIVSRDIVSVVGSTSVQERSRMFAQRSESQEAIPSPKNPTTPSESESRSLRAAKSMDGLHKPLSTLTSGPRVRDRLNSYETNQSNGSVRPPSQSTPTVSADAGRRVRSRASSDLGLSFGNSTSDRSERSESQGGGEDVRAREKEALLQRDYRDVLRKLGRSKDTANSAEVPARN